MYVCTSRIKYLLVKYMYVCIYIYALKKQLTHRLNATPILQQIVGLTIWKKHISESRANVCHSSFIGLFMKHRPGTEDSQQKLDRPTPNCVPVFRILQNMGMDRNSCKIKQYHITTAHLHFKYL